ncbi:unnamed protein product, partial [Allacma fusca]
DFSASRRAGSMGSVIFSGDSTLIATTLSGSSGFDISESAGVRECCSSASSLAVSVVFSGTGVVSK